MTTTRLAASGLALLLFVAVAAAAPGRTGATQTVVAQISPSASPEESPTPAAPAPAQTVAPTPNTMPPNTVTPTTPNTEPAGTLAPQGGVQNNANGPNWLDKFNRHPATQTGTGMGHMSKGMPTPKKMKMRPAATPPPR